MQLAKKGTIEQRFSGIGLQSMNKKIIEDESIPD